MELQFLGTGAGMPSKMRNTSSLILNLSHERGTYWMFDCGEATQHQMLHTTLKPRKVEKIFITHLHGDHTFGLPGFLGSRSFLGGEGRLDLYGPYGIKEWIKSTLRISRSHINYELVIHEISDGIVFEDDDFCVEAALLDHVIPCYGYRITQKPLPRKLLIDKALEAGVPKGPLLQKLKEGEDVTLDDGTIVYSEEVTDEPKDGFVVTILGDTCFCDASITLAKDADVVVHEATFDIETSDLASDYGHSTIVEAAEVAAKSGAKLLIANHISARFLPSDLKKLKEQGEAVFPNIQIAEDFSVFEWKEGRVIPVNK